MDIFINVLKLAEIVQSATVRANELPGNRHKIKGLRLCCMNVQQEQVVEALVCHRASQESLDPTKRRERPLGSGTCHGKREVRSEKLINLTKHALDHLTLVKCVSNGPNVCHLLHMDGGTRKGGADGVWQHQQLDLQTSKINLPS